jgi:hypothetical protein
MSTPTLVQASDIWEAFPVKGSRLKPKSDGEDRYGIQWDRTKLTTLSSETGKSIETLKAEIEPRLRHAIDVSPKWEVEPAAAGAGSAYIMTVFLSEYLPNLNVGTRHAPRRIGVNVTDIIAQARGLIQKTTEKTVDAIIPRFVELVPKNKDESKELMKLVYELAVNQQIFHPVTMKLIRAMDAKQKETKQYHKKPSKVIAKMAYEMAEEGAAYVEIQKKYNEENNVNVNSAEIHINKSKMAFRSNLLFFGYLYHQDMLSFEKLEAILKQYKSGLKAEDYREQDAAIEAMLYILVRAGKSMSMTEEGSELLKSMIKSLKKTTEKISRMRIKIMVDKFMEAVEHDYRIDADVSWAIGAPEEGVRIKVAKTRRSPKPEGLGEDIGELWRRFPLAVKQQGDRYDVSFHRDKLAKRFTEKNRSNGEHKNVKNLEATLERHILALIDNSRYWKRGPEVRGTFVTVVPKHSERNMEVPSGKNSMANTRRSPRKEALGEDIGELWRRFPLAVNKEGDRYDVSFHRVKLTKRFTEKNRSNGQHRNVKNLQATLERHILALIDNSKYWKRGPVVPGTFVTVVRK